MSSRHAYPTSPSSACCRATAISILLLELKKPEDAIPPCVSYKPFVCVLPCRCCFDSFWRNEMLRVYWLLIWVVRAAARATRAVRDNAACNSQTYSFNMFSMSVEIV